MQIGRLLFVGSDENVGARLFEEGCGDGHGLLRAGDAVEEDAGRAVLLQRFEEVSIAAVLAEEIEKLV